jgi:hypothetical protein
MERRNRIVRLASKKLAQMLDIDVLDAAQEVQFDIFRFFYIPNLA